MTDYSRGDYADLPAGKTDLENNYSAPDLTAIASNDNSTYAEQTANNEIAIHQYKKTVTGQYTNITWSGKSTLAPSESPVIMEVYNVTGTAWEELDRDDSTAADTDFDIIYNNLATADYLDSGVITWRVYQAASGGFVSKPAYGEAQINLSHPLGTYVTGCWLLNEGTGATINNLAATLPATGTLTGSPAWVASGLEFNGTNYGYLGVSFGGALNNFSLSMWITMDNLNVGSGGYSQTFLVLKVDDDNKVRLGHDESSPGGAIFCSYNYAGSPYGRITPASAVSAATPFNVVITRAAGEALKIYINGTPVDNAGCTYAHGDNNLLAGVSYTEGLIDGTIGSFFTFSKALSSSEVTQIYSDPWCFLEPV